MADIPIPRELVERAPTLYSITGDIKDINTLLIPRPAPAQDAEQAAIPSVQPAPEAVPLPCPFCGSGEWTPSYYDNGRFSFITCDNCDACGPDTGGSKAEAIAAWNRRAATQAQAEPALYISGPYHDGSMSVCELATGRILHKFRLDGPSAPVGDGATQPEGQEAPAAQAGGGK